MPKKSLVRTFAIIGILGLILGALLPIFSALR